MRRRRRTARPSGRPVAGAASQSNDYALGKSVAGEIKAYLETIPGVYNIDDNLKLGAPEEVQSSASTTDRAARHGLTFQDIAQALRAANDGVVASSFREASRHWARTSTSE